MPRFIECDEGDTPETIKARYDKLLGIEQRDIVLGTIFAVIIVVLAVVLLIAMVSPKPDQPARICADSFNGRALTAIVTYANSEKIKECWYEDAPE